MAKKRGKFKPLDSRKHPDLITFRLNEPYLSKLAEVAKKNRKSYTIMAKEIVCSFIDNIISKENESKSDNVQLRFTKNVMAILKHFIQKHGIEDYNIALNYLLLRGALLDVKLPEVNGVNVNEVWNEMINLKKVIKRAYIKKLATQRIERLQEENKAQAEALSRFIN